MNKMLINKYLGVFLGRIWRFGGSHPAARRVASGVASGVIVNSMMGGMHFGMSITC